MRGQEGGSKSEDRIRQKSLTKSALPSGASGRPPVRAADTPAPLDGYGRIGARETALSGARARRGRWCLWVNVFGETERAQLGDAAAAGRRRARRDPTQARARAPELRGDGGGGLSRGAVVAPRGPAAHPPRAPPAHHPARLPRRRPRCWRYQQNPVRSGISLGHGSPLRRSAVRKDETHRVRYSQQRCSARPESFLAVC